MNWRLLLILLFVLSGAVVCGKLGGEGGGGANLPTSGIIPFDDLLTDDTFEHDDSLITFDGADRVASPWVVASTGSGYQMLFSVTAAGKTAIYLAESTDALKWSLNSTALLSPKESWQSDHIDSPTLVRHNGKTLLWFAGGNGAGIGLATSDDGKTFVVRETPVLVPELAWEAGHVAAPSVLWDGEKFRLYYQAANGKAIGYAESSDGISWTRQPEPILTTGTAQDAWNRDFVGSPRVFRIVQTTGRVIYRMYFTGGLDQKRSIGYAGSHDGKQFQLFDQNPIYAPRQNAYDPCVITWGDGLLMFYTRDAKKGTGIFMAGHRVKGPIEPVDEIDTKD